MTNNALKQITDLLEKRPLGQYLDFRHAVSTPAVRAASDMAVKLRLVCFPNQGFSKCALFRGCAPAVLQTHTSVAEGDGYVVMWKHGQGGTVRISSVAWSDFWKDDFDTKQWNIVVYWGHRDTSKEDTPTPPEDKPMDTDDPPHFDDPDKPMPPASSPTPEEVQSPDLPMPPAPEENPQVPREWTIPPPAPPPPDPESDDMVPTTDITSPATRSKDRKPPTPEKELEQVDKRAKKNEIPRERTDPSSSSSRPPVRP